MDPPPSESVMAGMDDAVDGRDELEAIDEPGGSCGVDVPGQLRTWPVERCASCCAKT